MAYDPPTGKELKALKTLSGCAERLRDLLFVKPYTGDLSIDPSHALEGLRRNSMEAICVPTFKVLGHIRAFAKAAADARKKAERADRIALRELVRAEKAMSGFRICPRCKGKCGGFEPPEQTYSSNWEICDRCEGRGLMAIAKRRSR